MNFSKQCAPGSATELAPIAQVRPDTRDCLTSPGSRPGENKASGRFDRGMPGTCELRAGEEQPGDAATGHTANLGGERK